MTEPSRSAAATAHAPLNKWWTYQRERFPLLGHGLLIAAFSFSAVCFSALLREQVTLPAASTLTVAFVTSFMFFLQLRIADEFKDFEEDARYRPYRPVPRGLVSLKELGVLGLCCGLIQLGLGLWLEPAQVLLLAIAWAYLALMSKEFFVSEWLKTHPIPYLISHMVIIPLVDLYATACDWWPAGSGPPRGLIWFLIVSYFNGIVIELGRKIRGPKEEEPGVNTYSALWGRGRAVLVWLGAMLATAGFAATAAVQISFLVPTVCVLGVLLLTAAGIGCRFLQSPIAGWAKRIETFSAVWTLLMYLSLGAVPLVWRAMRGAG
jgi:4-hydroxybenzoate polyprenyltransferase